MKSAENISKRRLKARHIVLILLAVIMIAAGIFAYINRENITALYYAYRNSPEELAIKQQENNDRIQEALGKLTETKMRELTAEENKLLEEGKLSKEEAIQLIVGNTDEAETAQPQGSKDTSKKDEIIASIYMLRGGYAGRIDGLIAEAKRSYSALPKAERTNAAKMAIADEIIAKGNALEAECDAQMYSLLDSLSAELQELGESTDIIEEIRNIYIQEKRLKKASLMSAY